MNYRKIRYIIEKMGKGKKPLHDTENFNSLGYLQNISRIYLLIKKLLIPYAGKSGKK